MKDAERGRTTCGNYPKWESKLYQNESRIGILSKSCPIFCSNFAFILFKFSSKAIYKGALRAEIIQNVSQNYIKMNQGLVFCPDHALCFVQIMY